MGALNLAIVAPRVCHRIAVTTAIPESVREKIVVVTLDKHPRFQELRKLTL